MNNVMDDFENVFLNAVSISSKRRTKEQYFTPSNGYPALCEDPGNFGPDLSGLGREFKYGNFNFNFIYYKPIINDEVDITAFITEVREIAKELITNEKLNTYYLFSINISFPKKKRYDNEEFKAIFTIKGEVV